MHQYIVFLKKEFTEQVRTYKLLILVLVFLLLGVMNPLTAKLTPLLLSSLSAQGFAIDIPEVTAVSSWEQFFKNGSQMGVIAVLIVFCGLISKEISKGTLLNMLTKGLSRRIVLLSKITVCCILYTAAYLLSFAVTAAGTALFWNGEDVHHLFFSVFCLWLFGLLLLAAEVFGGALFGKTLGSLLFAGGFFVVLSIVGVIPQVSKYNPLTLTGGAQLVHGINTPADVWPAVLIAGFLILAFFAGAIIVFRKTKIV